jgi:basic amino acid/polyamine antiporter, APA family
VSRSGSARPLGFYSATAMVIGSMIGSGVFLLPAVLAPFGAASLLGWAITLLGALLLAIVYSWLSKGFSISGGAYIYARAAFGDRTAFFVAWSSWICMWVGNAALAVAFAGALVALLPASASSVLDARTLALAGLWLCTYINWLGVRQAGWVQLLATLLKLVPLLLFGLIACTALPEQAFVPFNPSQQDLWQVTSSVAAVTLWAFLGFEAATIPAGSIQNPERTVPRATIVGMLLAGLATMLACTVVIGLLPTASLASSSAPLVSASAHLWGENAGIAMAILAAVSCFGALNGWVLLQAQVPSAAARDNLFPKMFMQAPHSPSPRFGLIASSTLASVLVIANYTDSLLSVFKFSILLSTAAALLPYAVSVAAWLQQHPSASIGRKSVAWAALLYALWALWQTGTEALLWAAVLLMLGLPVLIYTRFAQADVD